MYYFPLFIWTLLLSSTLLGQTNDCAKATTVCGNLPPSGNPQGIGNVDDFSDPDNDPGCLSSEGNSAWFYFEIETGAPSGLTLEFSIIPAGGYGEDYDWALFGPDVDCGNLKSPIRCSSAPFNCAFCPETGLGMGAIDHSEGPGGEGDGFVAPLLVNEGEGYYIAINNWYSTDNGFTMTFGGDAAKFIDCTAAPPCSVEAIASEDVTVCEGGVPVQINVTPAGGLSIYSFSWVGTGNSGDYLNDPTAQDPIVTIPFGGSGPHTYYVTVTDGICEASDSIFVTITPHSPLLIDFLIGLDQEGQSTILNPKVNKGTPPYFFLWSDGSTSATRSDLSPGIYQITVTDGKGCTQAKEIKFGIPGGGAIGNGRLQIEVIPGTADLRMTLSERFITPSKIDIYDTHGRLVRSVHVSEHQKEINTTLPHSGLYWITFQIPDGGRSTYSIFIP